jgi:hypothetical protein
MCISGSVGALAQNRRDDVKTVQMMLNFARPSPLRPLDADGAIGKATIDTIHEYQTRMVKSDSPNGQVNVGSDTLRSLRVGIPAGQVVLGALQGVALPDLACHVACWFWGTRGLNALAGADDITRVTRKINGGLNGLADRQALYARARCMFNLT